VGRICNKKIAARLIGRVLNRQTTVLLGHIVADLRDAVCDCTEHTQLLSSEAFGRMHYAWWPSRRRRAYV
jgi:hypothetical protein